MKLAVINKHGLIKYGNIIILLYVIDTQRMLASRNSQLSKCRELVSAEGSAINQTPVSHAL